MIHKLVMRQKNVPRQNGRAKTATLKMPCIVNICFLYNGAILRYYALTVCQYFDFYEYFSLLCLNLTMRNFERFLLPTLLITIYTLHQGC